ncbi:MAG: DMT family transporter [Actinobacteria bacterium]|nr:DMT family transporter [Actinomycetota bacterium]
MIDARIRAGLAWAFLAVFLWSFTVPLTKVAVEGFDAVLTATGRAVIAGVIAGVVLVIRRIPLPPRHLWKSLFFVMLGAVFGWPVFMAIALNYTTAAHASVIAAFLPLSTAIFAVALTRERVTRAFWFAAVIGTGAVVVFSLSRGELGPGSLLADGLLLLGVIAASISYVLGTAATKTLPGWQVISWVVVMALPITIPASAVLWWLTKDSYTPSGTQWGALILLGVSSMYLGFFAWYRGLSQAGVAYGGQVQQLQVLFSLLWSALLLGEVVTWITVGAAIVVIAAVAWAQVARAPGHVVHSR